jgi:N-carbamoylputrescine amidase
MRVTVCELPNAWSETDEDWSCLIGQLSEEKTDLLVLPEMPFHRWLAGSRDVDLDKWKRAVEAHDRGVERLRDLSVGVIAGSRPVLDAGGRYNEGFIWEKSTGYHPVHRKCYLPDEEAFWEASWYERGKGDFDLIDVNGMIIGFQICTELWFSAHAREYAKQGIQLLVCPRATPLESIDTWLAGARTAAVVSGAFCLSSNYHGRVTNEIDFGGLGWIIEPEAGRVLGVTSRGVPFLTLDIDLSEADRAKKTYPRYVADE